VLDVTSVDLVRHTGVAVSGPPVLGVMGPHGSVTWPAAAERRNDAGWTVTLRHPTPATALVVRGPARAVSNDSVVDTVGGDRYQLDGYLQNALGQTGWRFTGIWREYAQFAHPVTTPPVWLVHPAPGARVRQVATYDWGTEVDRVDSPVPVTVVRSEAFQVGWRVVATGPTGTTRNLAVGRDGLIQSVRVPAGSWTLTFLYRPPDLNAGLAGTTVAVLGLAGLGAVGVWRRRRPRRTERGASPGSGGRADEPVAGPTPVGSR
jgi:MYXO-CTERM domain-containing protein